MQILVACEESQAVTVELRKLGHEAYSCDILPCSGGHHEWHIQNDVLNIIKPHPDGNGFGYRPYINFVTIDGTYHVLGEKWDMIIAFPPCTHLAVSGAKHFSLKRQDGRQKEAIEFFMQLYNANCDKIAIENPVGIISGGGYLLEHFPEIAKKYNLPITASQKIQPYEFGDEAQKTTCLWLKGLPLLKPTNIVGKGEMHTTPSGKTLPKWYSNSKKKRNKTFPGIAKAMANQWTI